MNRRSLRMWMSIAGMTAAATCGQLQGNEYCEDDGDECVCENDGPAHHIHFSSQEIDIYDQTPDTVYKDADWPSRIEEYSDYLSK